MAKGRKTGGGSRKGKPNNGTQELREMVLGALDLAGGQKYLQGQADSNPTAFLALIGKCLPREVTGAGGKDLMPGKIIVELVRASHC